MKNFIFSEKRSYIAARHIAFWLAWTIVYIGIYTPKVNVPGAFKYALSFYESGAFLTVHVLLSYFVIYVVISRYILRSRYLMATILLLVAVVVAGLLSQAIGIYIIDPYRDQLGLPDLADSTTVNLMSGLRGGISVAGFAGIIKLLKYWYVKKVENEELLHAKVSAELNLLKAQLHPHLLFNTLNNLYSHILRNSDQSGNIVLKLSELLRYMLHECGNERVPLAAEIRMMENYVELERIRYDENVDISIKTTGVRDDKWIAPLILLPFVENAFKHGVSQIIGESWISVNIEMVGQNFSLKVINTVSENPENKVTSGIGLANVKKRLELLYPDKHTLRITAEEELFIISLKITLDEVSEEQKIKMPSQYEPS